MSGPEHVVEFVNQAHLRAFGSEDWIGNSIGKRFPRSLNRAFSSVSMGST